MASAKVKARLKAMRKKFHLGEFKKTKSASRKKTKRSVKTMARRGRFRSFKRRASSGFKRNNFGLLIGAALYGAARPKLNEMAQPILEKLPFGEFNNEVLFGGGATLAKMFTGNKYVDMIATPMQVIESASAGELLLRKTMGATTSTTNVSGNIPVYG